MANKHRSTQSTRNILLAVLILIVIVAFPVRMAWGKRDSDIRQAKTDRAATQAAEAEIRQAQSIESHWKAEDQTRTAIGNVFPTSPMLSSELGYLRAAAQQSGVQLESVTQTAPLTGVGALGGQGVSGGTFGQTLGAAESIPVEIQVQGIVLTVEHFMTALRASGRFFGVYEQSWSWNQLGGLDAVIQGQIGFMPGQPRPIKGR